MKKYLEKLDQKYLKICAYAAVTVIATICITAILLTTGSFWLKLWAIISAMFKPIIIGGIICYLLLPIVNKLESLFKNYVQDKWARGLSVLVTFLIIFAAIIFILCLTAVAVYKNVESFNLNSIQTMFLALKNDYQEIWTFLESNLRTSDFSTDDMTQFISAATSSVKNFFSGLLFGVIFSIYFLMDGTNIFSYWTRVFQLFLNEKTQNIVLSLMKDADIVFSGYIRGQFVDALIVGFLASIALSVTGVPYAVIVGIFTGFGNLVPYVGPVVGYISLIIVCLPTSAFDKMIIGAVIMALIMFIDANVINPKLLSDNVDVHPLLVVAALIGGGALGGIAGMIIAVPTAALIKIQFDRYLQKLESKPVSPKDGSSSTDPSD
ncbi:MAG: AI-2E family transporter [Lachnospiraceae bacterium]|nr:AI-2E family transporter [Lachnospiraceae bacterium]